MSRLGTSVQEFFVRFPDEDACLQHIFATRWGAHTVCPRCRELGRWMRIRGTKKYLHTCRRQISVLEGTAMYRSNLSLMAWFYAMLLFANSSIGMRSCFIRRQLGLGSRSASRLTNQIRLHMAGSQRPTQVGGAGKLVYIDEALLRFAVSKESHSGSISKIVMGMACNGIVVTGIIPDRKRLTITSAIQRWVHGESVLVTDGHASYKRLSTLGWRHKVVNHTHSFSDFAGTTQNEIETYWRVLKRTLAGYRRVDEENLWLYLAEVEYRYNFRRSAKSTFEHLIAHFPRVDTDNLPAIKAGFNW